MHRPILAIFTAAGLLVSGSAFAQTPAEQRMSQGQRLPEPSAKLSLSMEQEHVIKEFLRDKPTDTAQGQTPETVGASVDDRITLFPMPDDLGAKVPQVKSHRYFVKERRIFLVDPRDNTIVEIID